MVTPNAITPTVKGTLVQPGGATVANKAGKNAVSIVPIFWAIAMPETRARVGNSSG